MRGPEPRDLVATLVPSEAALLKREPGTLVWRETRADGARVVAKLYRRRSRLTFLRSKVTRFRVEREFRRLLHLHRAGIPCTEPLGWAEGSSKEHGCHELLLMREVPDAVPLDEVLREQGAAVHLAPLYRVVRRMHESGFCHQTLYAANVLFSRSAPPGAEFFLSDVPRSWTFPRSLVGTRLALWDLLDLEVTIGRAGGRVGPEALAAYGLDDATAERRAREIGRDSTTKWRRLLRDLAARGRWIGAWSAFWKGRGAVAESR